MSNIYKSRRGRTSSRSSHLPSVGSFAETESVSRMFSNENFEHQSYTSSLQQNQATNTNGSTNSVFTVDNSTDTIGKEGSGNTRKSRRSVLMADEGPSPYGCNLCGATLHSRTALKSHIMQEHEGKHVVKCPHCEKAFTRPSQLRKHIYTSHDERTGEYYCDQCTFKNRDIEVFNQHIHLHKVCKYCRNEFSQLSRHEPKCPHRPY